MMTSARVVESQSSPYKNSPLVGLHSPWRSNYTITKSLQLQRTQVLEKLYLHALHVLKRIPVLLAQFFGHLIGFIAQKNFKISEKKKTFANSTINIPKLNTHTFYGWRSKVMFTNHPCTYGIRNGVLMETSKSFKRWYLSEWHRHTRRKRT